LVEEKEVVQKNPTTNILQDQRLIEVRVEAN
jgi:hypothetical protein